MSLNKALLCRTGNGYNVYAFPPQNVHNHSLNGDRHWGGFGWNAFWDYSETEKPIPTEDFPPNAVRPFRQLVINERDFFI